jgi:hypothetical protein
MGGLQLLHAVYAVEQFLNELKRRDCNFDVVLSRELQNIFAHAHGPKYELTRRILISILTNQVSISIQLSLIPSRAGKVCNVCLAMQCMSCYAVMAGTGVPSRLFVYSI